MSANSWARCKARRAARRAEQRSAEQFSQDIARGDAETRSEELKEFHRTETKARAAWMTLTTVLPIVAAVWRYFRGRGGLNVVELVTREDAAE